MPRESELVLNALIHIWNELPKLAGSQWTDLHLNMKVLLDKMQEEIDLDRQAIRAFQQAKLTLPDQPKVLINLSAGLSDRYRRTRALKDLEEAIRVSQQKVKMTPHNSPDRQKTLTTLGIGFSERYNRTGELKDLDTAILLYRQALELIPPDSPARSSLLNKLGSGLIYRYRNTGVREDLEEAIHTFQQALELAPPNSLDRPLLLNNLGYGLGANFLHTGVPEDLEKAIRVSRQAVELTSPDSPDRPIVLFNLGMGLNVGDSMGLGTLKEDVLAYKIKEHIKQIPEAKKRLVDEINNLRSVEDQQHEDDRQTTPGDAGLGQGAKPMAKSILAMTNVIEEVRQAVHEQDKRYLHGKVSRAGDEEEVDVLTINTKYKFALWLGVSQAGKLRVPEPLDLSHLPPPSDEEARYLLDILFWATNQQVQKQQISLRLKDPESSSCTFYFDTPSSSREFKAYILVSYQNKVMLQTAVLEGKILEPDATHTDTDKLSLQSVVLKDYQAILQNVDQSSYDWMALNCLDGLLLPKIGGFFQPPGFEKDLTAITNILIKASTSCSEIDKLTNLARHGGKMYEHLCKVDSALRILAIEKPDHRPRLQLVEPPDNPFPIELLYVHRVPSGNDVKICTDYQPSTDNFTCPTCSHRDETKFKNLLCPAGFLGIRAVIERYVLESGKPDGGYQLKVDLEPESKSLAPLERVVWAASEKVTTGTDMRNVIQQLSGQSKFAENWRRYDELVAELKPTLILLMPHVTEDDSALQNFEISDIMQSANKKTDIRLGEDLRDNTRAKDGPQPLVLLLGCSTAQIETPFLSSVTAFRAGGAAVTVATLAPIHESHATAIAGIILKVLTQITDQTIGYGCSVGEFMTLVRCAALEQGYYDALGLITDGDADWYITSKGENTHV